MNPNTAILAVMIMMHWLYNETDHCDLKVSSSQAKLDESFANYFLKTKAKNECLLVLNVHVKGYRKSTIELER